MVPGAAGVPRAQPAASTTSSIFFTYLYAPTVLGVRVAPHKTILVPTAHDEPAIHLEIYKEMFSAPAGIAYNTDVERRFLTTHFSIRAVEEETVGCGVDLSQAQVYQHDKIRGRSCKDDPDAERADAGRRAAAGLAAAPRRRAACSSSGATACTGRSRSTAAASIAGKGCEELIEYFSSYVQDGGDASLVLMGVKLMPLPEEPFIHFAGRLPDNERAAGARGRHGRRRAVAVREPVAAGARGVRRRHAGPRQRAQRSPGGSLPEEQRRPLLRGPRRVRGGDEAAGRRPPAARARWAATAAPTCARTTAGT